MMSLGIAGLVGSAGSLAAVDGRAGSNAATCTSFGFAASLAILSAIGSALLGLRSLALCALAILIGVVGFNRAGVTADATVAVATGAASSSSSSSSRAKSKSLP